MTSKLGLGLTIAAALVLLSACGGNVTASGGSGGGAGSTSSGGSTNSGGNGTGATGTGGSTSSGGSGGGLTGDCQTAADCNGNACVEVTPGGFKICTSFPNEATMCNPNNPVPDECCTSADCAKGKCYLSTDLPYCGGPAMAEYNHCVADQCASDAECGANQICAPAGAWGYPSRICMTAYCKTNADCSAKTGGTCAPVNIPCCSVAAGLACIYPGGCRADGDCASDGSKHCEIDPATKSGVCKDGPAPCPA